MERYRCSESWTIVEKPWFEGNHLDVDAKDELKRALQEYKGSILMVCHEPEFYEGLATDIWDFSKLSS